MTQKMKNILTAILFCIFCSNLMLSHSYCEEDSVSYLAAYNYIFNDSINKNKHIVVADSIIDLDRFFFSEDLKDHPQYKEIVDSFRARKGYVWDESYYSPCLNSLFCNQNKTSIDHVLFFSKISDNMLCANLIFYSEKQTRIEDIFRYDRVAMFTTGFDYLFIFEKDGSIKEAFRSEVIID